MDLKNISILKAPGICCVPEKLVWFASGMGNANLTIISPTGYTPLQISRNTGPREGEMREVPVNNLPPQFTGVRRGVSALTVGKFPSLDAKSALWVNLPHLFLLVAPDSGLSEILPHPLSSVARCEVGIEAYSLL